MSIGLPLTLGGVGINGDLPAAVSYLNLTNQVVGGKAQVEITWGNPASNFGGVAIVRKEGSAPTHFTDGELIYEGTDTSYVDANVTENTSYYYRAYTYNARRQIQTTLVVQNITVLFGKKTEELALYDKIYVPENGVNKVYFKISSPWSFLREKTAGKLKIDAVTNSYTGDEGTVAIFSPLYPAGKVQHIRAMEEYEYLDMPVDFPYRQAYHEALYGSTWSNGQAISYWVWSYDSNISGGPKWMHSGSGGNKLYDCANGSSYACRPAISLTIMVNPVPDRDGVYSLL